MSFLTDKIVKGFDEGLLTGTILINVQKAFDTIDMKFWCKCLKQLVSQRDLYSGLVVLSFWAGISC